ncbi:hypothetical protein ACWGJV_38365 [Streptomyces tendae]
MTQPYHSPYAPPIPVTTNDEEDKDVGKDLSYLVPNVSVSWDAPPSFNDDPKKGTGEGGGDQMTEVLDSGPILFNASSVRAAEVSMLDRLRVATFGYERMRAHVLTLPDTLFGPPPPDKPVAAMNAGAPGNSSGASPMADGETDPEGTKMIHELGVQFSEAMKPAMEKALYQIANSLTLTGQYLALVNRAGQSYAYVDRNLHFPPPPSSSGSH